MFFLYAILSMLGYALQSTLLAQYARKMDALSLGLYRNISFSVTLLPLLFGASPDEVMGVLSQWPLLLLSGIAGGISLSLSYASYRYLTVGVSGALGRAVYTLILAAFGWMVFRETLSYSALSLIALIIAGSVVLGMVRNRHAHLTDHVALGVFLVAVGSCFFSITYAAPVILSRSANPLVGGFFWELSIGIAAGFLILLRSLFLRKGLQRVRWRTFLMIAAVSSPTLVGTAFYTLAVREGPVAVVTSILNASLVVTSLLGWWLYRERLRWIQWVAMFFVLAGVVGLKFV